MALGELTLKYEPEPAHPAGRLSAEINAEGFAGATSYYAEVDDVLPFVTQLSAYPLTGAILAIGSELDGGPVISVKISQADSTGRFFVWVELAYDGDRRRRVSAGFVTVYGRIETFGRSLAHVLAHGGSTTLVSGS